jgi:hypothetical protein
MMQSQNNLHRQVCQGVLALALSCILGSGVASASDLNTKAEEIASMHAEVARLSEQVSTREEAHRMRLRSLETQRADLELQIRRVEAQQSALAEALSELEETTVAPVDDAAVTAEILKVAPELRTTITDGLPFRTQERLDDFDALIAKIEAGELQSGQAAARVWAWVEDERRLGRENGVDRQTITLKGQEVMVEVARLGMVALYYRSPTGEIGRATREADGWTWNTIADRNGRSQVNELFNALTRGVRTGWFELPTDWMEPS